ncbi:MAG TPA: DUF2185 domain-containing protein [Candidatus Limnocylindria bacterium]|nr:DUF2185 domain-containing protein [Candidatus Limnocylindria bacterium]
MPGSAGQTQAAWFSRRVVEGERPGYVERTADRINEHDSGWRFYVGDESQAYLDATENCVMQHLCHATERWPELASVVADARATSEWRWDDAAGAYRPYD